jgi:hypothetical protein
MFLGMWRIILGKSKALAALGVGHDLICLGTGIQLFVLESTEMWG